MSWLKGNDVCRNIPFHFLLEFNEPIFGPGTCGRHDDIYTSNDRVWTLLGSFHIPEGNPTCHVFYFPISLPWEVTNLMDHQQPRSFSYRMHMFRSMEQGFIHEKDES
jgi:hypothetical protein